MIFARFGSEYDCLKYLTAGWAAPEPEFVWSDGKRSIISLPRPSSLVDAALKMTVSPFTPEAQPFQPISVVVNGSTVGECIVRGRMTLEFFLSHQVIAKSDLMELALYYYAPLRPSDVGISADRRLLSIALVELRVEALTEDRRRGLLDENLLRAPDEVAVELTALRSEDDRWVKRLVETKRAGARGLPLMIEAYMRGAGALCHLRQPVADAIGDIVNKNPNNTSIVGPTLDSTRQLNRDLVQRYAPPFLEFIFDHADIGSLTVEEIFPPSQNQAYYPEFDLPCASGTIRPNRPALRLYSSDEATAYVHPFSYAVYDTKTERLFPAANPQGLSNFIVHEKCTNVDQDIVIVQDQFDGGNFAHFLFDTLTRIYHYAGTKSQQLDDAVFILGGIPKSFHRLLLATVADDLSLREDQLFFPRSGWNVQTSRSVFFFSDQIDYLHPAQMMHPESVAVLRRLAKRLPIAGADVHRVYISRTDSALRRLSNESHLVSELEKLGFVCVRLSDLSALDQIRLIASASVVVAPHGMGLTHLAFHQGQPTVVELFNPELGSDDYAFLSKALGFDYYPVVGRQTDALTRDFEIDVEEVMALLQKAGIGGGKA